jgi:hypothetical protein
VDHRRRRVAVGFYVDEKRLIGKETGRNPGLLKITLFATNAKNGRRPPFLRNSRTENQQLSRVLGLDYVNY